jgi:hypothetical protein
MSPKLKGVIFKTGYHVTSTPIDTFEDLTIEKLKSKLWDLQIKHCKRVGDTPMIVQSTQQINKRSREILKSSNGGSEIGYMAIIGFKLKTKIDENTSKA